MRHSDSPTEAIPADSAPDRALSLRATAIALDRKGRPAATVAEVTDIQRLLAWYFSDSSGPNRTAGNGRAA